MGKPVATQSTSSRRSGPWRASTTSELGIASEIGPLRQVLVHRPGQELARLTPDNKEALLFDEVPWLEGAQEEHDRFVDLLRGQGVEVLYLLDLLADVLELDDVRARLVAAALDEPALGGELTRAVRSYLDRLAPAPLAQTLVGGLTVEELSSPAHGLVAGLSEPTAFVIEPLPNHMFTRDASAWIGTRAYLGRMASAARGREALHLEAIYTRHPHFADRPEPFRDLAPLEGGDLLVVGSNRVLIGAGQRTRLSAVERLTRSLLAEVPSAEVALAVIPPLRRTMHLDTIVTMLDHDAFTVYPPAVAELTTYRLRLRGGELCAEPEPDLVHTLRRLTGHEQLRVIETGGDDLRRAREQWDDANNVLALRPGVVVGYDRNIATNQRLTDAGIEVLTFPGSELGRGRGGARCLSCPLSRRPLIASVPELSGSGT